VSDGVGLLTSQEVSDSANCRSKSKLNSLEVDHPSLSNSVSPSDLTTSGASADTEPTLGDSASSSGFTGAYSLNRYGDRNYTITTLNLAGSSSSDEEVELPSVSSVSESEDSSGVEEEVL
jgi:hypothetical protein